MDPYLPPIRKKQPTTSRKAVTRYNQPQVVVVQAKTPLIVVLMFSGKTIDQRTKRTVTEAETQKMIGSKALVSALLCDIHHSFSKCIDELHRFPKEPPLFREVSIPYR
jgi:hypothetical protein